MVYDGVIEMPPKVTSYKAVENNKLALHLPVKNESEMNNLPTDDAGKPFLSKTDTNASIYTQILRLAVHFH